MKEILEFINGSGAASEDDSKNDGAFSYAAEWHAFAHGFSDGSKTYHLAPDELPLDDPDVVKEPHYYKGGYIVGTLAQLTVALILLYAADVPIPF